MVNICSWFDWINLGVLVSWLIYDKVMPVVGMLNGVTLVYRIKDNF